jgi:hypothetical protein
MDLPVLRAPDHQHFRWLSDGGDEFAAQWMRLRALSLPDVMGIRVFERLCQLPFWPQLTSLQLHFPGYSGLAQQHLGLLRERWPAPLRDLGLFSDTSPDLAAALGSLVETLAGSSLKKLRLRSIPIRAADLARLLDETGAIRLQDLTITESEEIVEEHAAVLADSPGSKHLRRLDLSANWSFDNRAVRRLFASEQLRRLVHLDLSMSAFNAEAAIALASAEGWDRLRSLVLMTTALDTEGLRALVASPNLGSLTRLSVAQGNSASHQIDVPPDVAEAITRLPHLENLYVLAARVDPISRKILAGSEGPAWLFLLSFDDDLAEFRAQRAGERWLPLDEAVQAEFGPF